MKNKAPNKEKKESVKLAPATLRKLEVIRPFLSDLHPYFFGRQRGKTATLDDVVSWAANVAANMYGIIGIDQDENDIDNRIAAVQKQMIAELNAANAAKKEA